MELYERDGLYCRRATVMTPAKKPFYDEMRRRKLEKFIPPEPENHLRYPPSDDRGCLEGGYVEPLSGGTSAASVAELHNGKNLKRLFAG